jgi:hypothetical protein
MIKASLKTNEGRPVLLLGLSEGNLTLLREGKPILVDLLPFGMDGQVILIYGKTEDDITRDLAKNFKFPV